MSQTEPNLSIIYQPVDAGGARGPELRATWAELSIFVGSTCLTEFLDASARTVRSSVYLPVYPLAEWMANNWWSIQCETARPAVSSSDYSQRHNLFSAREGFALPNLSFQPQGDFIRLQWHRTAPMAVAGRFIMEPGSVLLPLGPVIDTLRSFINGVIARLDALNLTNTHLHEAWGLVQASENDPEESEFCATAGTLGLDPYRLDEGGAIEQAAANLPRELHEEFFRAINPLHLTTEAKAIVQQLKKLPSLTTNKHLAINRGPRHLPLNPAQPAWQIGYKLAHAFRHDGGNWARISGKIPVHQLRRIGSGTALSGLVEIGRRFEVLTNRPEGPALQFLKAQALCEQVVAADDGPSYALLSRAQTDRQARNRAFAAELLAPADKLRQAIDDGIEADDIDGLAARFEVSEKVIRHQLENHAIAPYPGVPHCPP